MKKILVLSMLLLMCSVIYSQNAYKNVLRIKEINTPIGLILLEDAITRGYWNDYDNDSSVDELRKFKSFLETPLDFSISVDVEKSLELLNSVHIIQDKNSFLTTDKALIEKQKKEALIERQKILDRENLISKLKNIGTNQTGEGIIPKGLSPTTEIISGIADFLVESTKKELTLAFFEAFKKKLDREFSFDLSIEGHSISFKYELKDFFSNSYQVLVSKNYFDVPSMGDMWITAFKKDLKELPNSLENLLNKTPYLTITNKGLLVKSIFESIRKIEKGHHPMEIIEQFGFVFDHYSSVLDNFENNPIHIYFGLTHLVSKNLSINDKDGLRKWVSMAEFQKLSKKDRSFLISLICREGIKSELFRNIQITKFETLEDMVKGSTENLDYLYFTIKNSLVSLNNLQNLLSKTKNEVKNDGDSSSYLEYLTSVFEVFNSTLEDTYKIGGNNLFYSTNYYDTYIPLINIIIEFVAAGKEKKYGDSLLMAIKFFTDFSEDDPKLKDFTNKLSYYGNFLVDIINASENEKFDVKSVISNYAAPVNSYRIKRRSNSSWDLNSYPGVFVGYEFSGSNSNSFGITAPIGFSYSWRCNKDEESGSNSIFLSAMDIAAPFTYRFRNDNDAGGLPENIKWDQIFSPGLFYVRGLKGSPLAFKAGFQWTPLLREIRENNILNEKNIFRIHVALTVDIPIFNFKYN